MILSLLNCRISGIIQLTKIHHCTTEMIGQLKEVSSRQETAKRMTIFSGGSKYPPFYVHSALPSREAKIAGKKNDCVTCKHDTDRRPHRLFTAMEEESWKSEEFDELPSSGKPRNHSSPQRSHSTIFNILRGLKRLVCSGVFLKGSAFAVGFSNPSKGPRAIMAIILLLLDICYVFYSVYYTFICHSFETPVKSLFCRNISSTNSSSTSLQSVFHGIDSIGILSLVSYTATLLSNATFFWCMWKLPQRTVHCVTLDKAFSTADGSTLVTLNLTMLIFSISLVSQIFWLNLTFKDSNYFMKIGISFGIIAYWAILTTSWIFVIITNAMKDCVTQFKAEIQHANDYSLDDIIRIHKRLCKQMSSTSEYLKVWFVTHWFMLAITTVIYVASMVSFFQQAIDWYSLYQHLLVSFLYLYVFVYPSYCAASVTTQCNRMLRELNMTTDEDWPTGHPFCNRSQLALFLQYAQYTNCGFQVGEIAFGSNFAWFSTLITLCGLGLKVL